MTIDRAEGRGPRCGNRVVESRDCQQLLDTLSTPLGID
jgi:hypothetical protein